MSKVRYTDRHRVEAPSTTRPSRRTSIRTGPWRGGWTARAGAVLRDHAPRTPLVHLDFACGTGRILEYFAGRVDSSTGVDVSDSMMEVAGRWPPKAELIEADLTQNDVLGDRRFNLITAFRFFPNAEPELRQAVTPRSRGT